MKGELTTTEIWYEPFASLGKQLAETHDVGFDKLAVKCPEEVRAGLNAIGYGGCSLEAAEDGWITIRKTNPTIRSQRLGSSRFLSFGTGNGKSRPGQRKDKVIAKYRSALVTIARRSRSLDAARKTAANALVEGADNA